MSKKRAWKNSVLLILVFAIFLLIIPNISSQESVKSNTVKSNIKSYTNSTFQKSCPCQPVSYYFYLKNTGNFVEIYSLTVEDDLARYTKSTIPSRFALKPSQETVFKLIIQAPCEIYGSRKFDFIIKAENSKLEAVYPLTYDILPCYSYDIETGELANSLENLSFIKREDSYSICENESKILPIKLANNAEFRNNFNVELTAKNAFLSINSFSLDSKKSVILPVYISIPQYDKTSSNLTLIFTSEKGKLGKIRDIELNSVYCVTPIIKIANDSTKASNEIIVNYTKQEKEFSVINQGNRKETYSITIQAPGWLKFPKTEAVLAPNQDKSFKFIIEPNESIKGKAYNAKIDVTALSTGNIYSKEFSIKLTGKSFSDKAKVFFSKAYSIIYPFIKTPIALLFKFIWSIILGLLILIVLIFLIRQYQEFRKSEAAKKYLFKQRIRAPKLRKAKIEKRYKKLAFPIISPYIIFLALVLVILILSYYNIKPEYFRAEPKPAEPYIKPFNISLANISLITPGIYNLSLNISLGALTDLKEKSPEYFYLLFFLLFIFLAGLIVYLVKRKKDWEFEKEFEKEIKEEAKKEVKEAAKKPIEKKEKFREKIYLPEFVLIAIAGIIILLALALFFFKFPYSITTFISNQTIIQIEEYKEPIIVNNTKIPALIIEQDRELVVNLTEYFYDPDNDKLYFSGLSGDNITVDINEQGIAILKPRKGFYGTSSIVFIADDKKDGIAKTNNITLVVRKSSTFSSKLISNIKDFLALYINFIILGFVLLILLILILYYRKRTT